MLHAPLCNIKMLVCLPRLLCMLIWYTRPSDVQQKEPRGSAVNIELNALLMLQGRSNWQLYGGKTGMHNSNIVCHFAFAVTSHHC